MFCKKGVRRNFAKFKESTCARASFLQPEACNFMKIESLTHLFPCEVWEDLSKNTFSYRTPLLAASVKACNFTKIRFATGVFFVNFLKISKELLLMHCKKFTKVLVKYMFAKYLSADGCFVKGIILLTLMITTMLSVS